MKQGNLPGGKSLDWVEPAPSTSSSVKLAAAAARELFLRIPPFPGARVSSFAKGHGPAVNPVALAGSLRKLRVGGTYWAAQPKLPKGHVLVRSWEAAQAAACLYPDRPIVFWNEVLRLGHGQLDVAVVSGPCDPWHMLGGAVALVTDSNDELRLVAALLHVPCYESTDGREFASVELNATEMVADLAAATFKNPFSGAAMDAIEAAELCGFWRQLIDANRKLAGGVGFAFWKQDHVAPLLWGGSRQFRFLRSGDVTDADHAVAMWRAKAAPALVAELERAGHQLIEVEDGFLRSRGLGADCIPPLSITVDRLGPHFDPKQASELELLLEKADFDAATLDRARELRSVIVAEGIGKYERGTVLVERRAGTRRHILVPGQVEDDRAVKAGGCGLTSNLELLKRVREQAPDAYILYKPHPDVLAGHRRGSIPDAACLRYADEIVGELPIASLIAMVDEVHVNTSLAGFEALLRDKKVTTYGVPFYAGWGLTTDLGPVPPRRSSKRSLDELVAATLLLYPRYLDPVTGLPCPAEVVVERLSGAQQASAGVIVGMRRLQGKLMRRLRSLVQ
ncbi:MAG TPA: capsule biosynthesis protein [Sphingomicrobium sp.]